MKTTPKSIYPAFAALAVACFAFIQNAHAVSPPPDGGYPGGNTAEGQKALLTRTTGGFNTAVGFFSLRSDTTGSFNTAVGAGTLLANTGDNNTAAGVGALFSNTTGVAGTAAGAFALFSNTTGSGNTGSGYQALFSNQTGANNAAYGYTALYHNTGNFNTAFGAAALFTNTTGSLNTATCTNALFSNATGASNTANGAYALFSNTYAIGSTAIGDHALYRSTTDGNIAIGFYAGSQLTDGASNIDIGNVGVAGEANTMRIGSTFVQGTTYIAGIAGQTVGAGGSTCYVDNDGKLGVFLSARRFKTDIADMAAASEGLLALRPVTFHYKPELDKTGIPQFGLVAEEVAKVNPDLVTHDAKGDIYTVRYEAVNAMLLNEFLKEHRKVEQQTRQIHEQTCKVEEQETSIRQLKSTVSMQEARIAQQQEEMKLFAATLKEQASQIQRVSAQIEVNRPVVQAALNND